MDPQFWEFAKASPVAAVMLALAFAARWYAKPVWEAVAKFLRELWAEYVIEKDKDRTKFDERQEVLKRQADATDRQARGTFELAKVIAAAAKNGVRVDTRKIPKNGKGDTRKLPAADENDEADDSGLLAEDEAIEE